MKEANEPLREDIIKIQQISIVPSLLDIICRVTGMGFAAVARVTEREWIACSVRDTINFGLEPGGQLDVTSTICNEIRESRKIVVFDNADKDPLYKDHHTPLAYGIKSYISVPVYATDGSFFGTLCAVDPEPKRINVPHIIALFERFSELITFHFQALEDSLSAREQLYQQQVKGDVLEQRLRDQVQEISGGKERERRTDILLQGKDAQISSMSASISKLNSEITELAYISSHDLQEPLRKIQMFANLILETERNNLSEKSLTFITKIRSSAERMQSLVADLLTYTVNSGGKNLMLNADMATIVQDALNDLKEELLLSKAIITVNCDCTAKVIPFQVRQVVYNCVSNSLRFAHIDRIPAVSITCETASGSDFDFDLLEPNGQYCRLAVEDNGMGFDQQFSRRIFDIFEKLENDVQIKNTGIGLAIVKKIADNHNGYVRAMGKESEGARFEIYFPA